MRKYIIGTATLAIVGVVFGAWATASNSGAGTSHTQDPLNGWQENPSIVTTGTGSIELRIDDDAQVIEFELTYSGLEGGAVGAAHIHIGSRGVNGSVSTFFCGGGTKPAVCPPAGTVTGTITPADVGGPTAQGVEPGSWEELVRAIRAGHAYANVHTERWGSGEIRGQINDDDQRQFTR